MKEISIEDLTLNPFTVFGRDWMALAVGNEQDGCNAMTVSWGQLGALWERGSHSNRLPTAVCYVRPSRYTKAWMEREEMFTLCHFDSSHRKALGYLGSHSGRDGDKLAAAGLTPVFEFDTIYPAEADLVFICRKLYSQDLADACFADREIVDFNYPERDFHIMYIGEIVKVLKREENANER